MSRIKTLLFVLALAAQVPLASAKVTYQVGGCLPKLTSFSTISAAVAATPAPNVVEVCPGTYYEQVVIDTPLTLEGITSANSTQSVIQPPSGGLAVNVTSIFGSSVAAQVLVETGPVNITNIVVSGPGSGNGSAYVAGIFYASGSFGTVNEVEVSGQIDDGEGVGIWAENGTSTMDTVTIENSFISWVDGYGVFMGSDQTTPTLTATVKGNTLNGDSGTGRPSFGVWNLGGTGSIAKNVVSGFGNTAIVDVQGSGLTISGNTITNSEAGISPLYGIFLLGSDEVVESNLVSGSGYYLDAGIYLGSGGAKVQANKIANSVVGIEFACNTATVSGNTITQADTGIDQVPSALAATNTYYGWVFTIRTDCDSASAAKAKPALLLKKLMP